jgi:uroporphyrinogen decarboxylase
MQGSIARVRAVLRGELPDRAPLYELVRNDAVINHFTGRTLTVENAYEVVYKAYEPAVDATRPLVRLPKHAETVILEDGREQRFFRWTIWTENRRYKSSEAYAAAKRAELDAFDPLWTDEKQDAMDRRLAFIAEERARLGEVFYFPGGPWVGLQGIFGEVGLEHFSYYLADCPGLIDELLESHTLRTLAWIEHLPPDHGIEAVFCGDDIAFKTGPFLRPAWFAEHYYDRTARVCSAYHARGIKVLFHSDGNLNVILDGLVEAGIDGLNPIETLAGMDVDDIHRRHPDLFMAGAIDVSQLLPLDSPQAVYDTVRRTIDAAQGRIMIGSSTELHNEVPLENYLALRQAVLDTPYR